MPALYVRHKPEFIGNRLLLSEHDLHLQVAEYLDLTGLIYHHSPNEGKRRPQYTKMLLRKGMRKGWPDIQILHRGRSVFIELKTKKGRLSTAQKKCHSDLILAGAIVKVCRSLEDVIQFVGMTCGRN